MISLSLSLSYTHSLTHSFTHTHTHTHTHTRTHSHTRTHTQNFKSVQTDEQKKAFILNLNDDVCMFMCSSRADMDDWYRDLQSYGEPRSGGARAPLRASISNTSDDFSGKSVCVCTFISICKCVYVCMCVCVCTFVSICDRI